MQINFDTDTVTRLTPHLDDAKKLLLTFEDGVGPYSQHAMIHMQVQFSLNIVAADADLKDYDEWLPSNLGPVGIKGYSAEDLDAHMTVRFNAGNNALVLSGDGGIIDSDLGFIDFTTPDGLLHNPAR